MKGILPILFLLSVACSAQTTTRITKASTIYDVSVNSGLCSDDGKCGPIKVTLYRKRSKEPFQSMVAGRLQSDDVSKPIEFIDINFDGINDLFIFDGITAPGGNATFAHRIFLYSPRDRQFVFNEELSQLSREESFLLEPSGLRRKQILTYARIGGGVFQNRWYRVVNNRPRMFKEIISDATYKNGTRTLDTTRTLVKGKWIVRKKITKTIFNQ